MHRFAPWPQALKHPPRPSSSHTSQHGVHGSFQHHGKIGNQPFSDCAAVAAQSACTCTDMLACSCREASAETQLTPFCGTCSLALHTEFPLQLSRASVSRAGRSFFGVIAHRTEAYTTGTLRKIILCGITHQPWTYVTASHTHTHQKAPS